LLHEIKHDGPNARAPRRGGRATFSPATGTTRRFPLIARAELSVKAASCLIDGEKVDVRLPPRLPDRRFRRI